MTETKTIYGIIEKKSSEDGVGKNGNPYTRGVFVIEGKNYSTFDKKIIDEFKPADAVKVDLEKNGEYWNMTTMELQDPKEVVHNSQQSVEVEKVVQKASNTQNAMYVSYAKDIFNTMLSRIPVGEEAEHNLLMDKAIARVKQAQKEF